LTIGGIEVPRRRVRVGPIEIVNALSGLLDGLLGSDILRSFDIDLDLPGRRMTLYQGQSCAAASPAWAPPYARIAAGRSPGNRLFFPVQLDGRAISALFDSGAQFSVLSPRTALALGVKEAVLARDPQVTVRGADGEQLSAHAHRFFRLEVDGGKRSTPSNAARIPKLFRKAISVSLPRKTSSRNMTRPIPAIGTGWPTTAAREPARDLRKCSPRSLI
jgi:hypothetical protein